MGVPRWVLQTVNGFHKKEKRAKRPVGPGSSEYKAGH